MINDLKDILHNSDITLDNDFRLALINDLIEVRNLSRPNVSSCSSDMF